MTVRTPTAGHRRTRRCLLDEFPTISEPTLAELIDGAMRAISDPRT